uniref:ABC transporter ATP-binding protein n=1 Tax=Dictyoglomus thermophilum TaxID=14 RepID=A0A7C3ML08_DICTH
MMEQDFLLYVKDLTKIFVIGGRFLGVKLVAVNKESFYLPLNKPEILTIAGETGSGKTTLARMILGLIEPTSGEIYYKGERVTDLSSRKNKLKFMKEVQPIFQNPFEAFNPLKRVDSYLFNTAINFGLAKNRQEAMDIVDMSLQAVGLNLKEIEKRYPHELSGGQLQRVSIARALITTPSLLVADEPVSMVDASLRMSIVNLFKELKEKYGVSVLYITHDLTTAYYISDWIAIMYRGNIVEIGPVEKVMLKPLHPYTKLLIDSVPEPDIDKRWEGNIKLSVQEVKEFSKLGCKFSDRCDEARDICFREEPKKILIDDRWVMCHKYIS